MARKSANSPKGGGAAGLPWWKTEGLAVAGGWHSLPARIRQGLHLDNEEELFAWECGDEHIRRLRAFGITVLIGQYDRGLGPTDQAPEQERSRAQAALCHRHGIRHGCYLANTVYFESMLKDHPECEDWVVRTEDGRFAYYGGEQTWRWVACFNSPGWRERMKREIEKAIAFVKTDWLHFDNLAVWPEPDSCHCRHCRAAFAEFLLDRYPDARSQRRRFGFAGLEKFRAPNFHLRFAGPWDLNRISNPLMRDWIDFRCRTVSDYIADLAAYARGLKPDIALDANGQSVWGVNQSLLHGIRHDHQIPVVDAVWEENPDLRDPERSTIPPVTRKLRGMNCVRRLGRQVITGYHTEEELAWNLALCGDPGIYTGWGYAEPKKAALDDPAPGIAGLLAHYRRHKDLYTLQRPCARTAVWRNHRSLAYDSFAGHLSACVLEHLLFVRRVPFGIVTDRLVNREGLADFDLLVLPNVQFVDDGQLDAISRFVAGGGAALITERTAEYDGEDRRRSRCPLKALLSGALRLGGTDVSRSRRGGAKAFACHLGGSNAVFAEHGKGRVAYLPKIAYVHPPRSLPGGFYNAKYQGADTRYWKEPVNASEIMDAIEWLHPGCRPVQVYGAPELFLDVVGLADGSTAVPLIRTGAVRPADLRFAVRSNASPKGARLYRPEERRPLDLLWERRGDSWETVLPGVLRHAVVRWGR